VRDILRREGVDVCAVITDGPGSAANIARKCVYDGADLILVAGGDGTVNEVVNGMALSDVPLGVLPCGTANVLASELGLGKKPDKVAAGLSGLVPARVSLGVLHSELDRRPRHFLLMAGAGFDASIVNQVDGRMKTSVGKLAYYFAGFSQLGARLPEFNVDVDDKRYRCSFALASRVRNYGGDLEIARNVSLLDHCFELVLFEGTSTFPYVRYLIGVLLNRLPKTAGVTVLHAKAARFSGPEDDRIHVQVDGELAGWLPVSVSIAPRSLTLLVPPKYCQHQKVFAAERVWTPSPTT
jgi:YegS/Rv2252/BmrU family lipid kinase